MNSAAIIVASIAYNQPALPPTITVLDPEQTAIVYTAGVFEPAPHEASAPLVLVGKHGGGRGGGKRGGFGRRDGGSKGFGRGGRAARNTENFSRAFPFFDDSDPRAEPNRGQSAEPNFFERLFSF